jgi:hypothetical protein
MKSFMFENYVILWAPMTYAPGANCKEVKYCKLAPEHLCIDMIMMKNP